MSNTAILVRVRKVVRFEVANRVSLLISLRSSLPMLITISGQSGLREKVSKLVLPGVKLSWSIRGEASSACKVRDDTSRLETFTVSEKVRKSSPESRSISKPTSSGCTMSWVYLDTGRGESADTPSTKFPFMSVRVKFAMERKVSSILVARSVTLFM